MRSVSRRDMFHYTGCFITSGCGLSVLTLQAMSMLSYLSSPGDEVARFSPVLPIEFNEPLHDPYHLRFTEIACLRGLVYGGAQLFVEKTP